LLRSPPLQNWTARVSILSGPDAEAVGGTRAYIGSANSVRERIKQSAAQREFRETAIAKGGSATRSWRLAGRVHQ
jgi:hypothetical protein